MWQRSTSRLLVSVIVVLGASISALSAENVKTDIVSVSMEQQYDSVLPGGGSALAVQFTLETNWHFYASAETAPGGMNLKVITSEKESSLLTFSEPIFPPSVVYHDKFTGIELDIFRDNFTVYIPFTVAGEPATTTQRNIDLEVLIDGAVCSDMQCRPWESTLTEKVTVDPAADMSKADFSLPDPTQVKDTGSMRRGKLASASVLVALGVALLAGLSLNIMPCVWPVLPIIVMRLVEQAKQSKGRSIAMGLAFCLGILLFFACLAGANIILQLFYETALQWGDQFRNPPFVAAMAILLVVLALFMFGVFTFTVPAAISGKSGSGKGFSGAIGMGFLAAILSTPCGFAILAAAFAWAQAQPLPLATVAIMIIGIGMAIPYVILTSLPGLLKRVPKPGRWMELFKQMIGFVLLIIAVKLIAAIPADRRMDVLYFSVVLSFCLWMWGGWVSYNTKPSRKLIVRGLAIALVVAAGVVFLPAPKAPAIDWKEYDGNLIEEAKTQDRPVLIKFTADWCLSCQVVEKTVYGRDDVADLIKEKNVLAIKADTTAKDYPATLALKNIYKEPAVPLTVLFLPDGKQIRWPGLYFADEIITQLQGI